MLWHLLSLFSFQAHKDNTGRINHTRWMRPLGDAWVKTASRFHTSFTFVPWLKTQLYCMTISNAGRHSPLRFVQLLFVIVLIYCWSESETDNFMIFYREKTLSYLLWLHFLLCRNYLSKRSGKVGQGRNNNNNNNKKKLPTKILNPLQKLD